MTYSQLLHSTRRLAATLRKRGFQQGVDTALVLTAYDNQMELALFVFTVSMELEGCCALCDVCCNMLPPSGNHFIIIVIH